MRHTPESRSILGLVLVSVSVAMLSQAAPPDQPAASVQFTNVTKSAGVTFVHYKGANGTSVILEEAGLGVCVADFDGDGYQDIYFVNGRDRYKRGITVRNALYRNNGDGTFTDVTEKAGAPGNAYGLGCVWGDYDNDGFPDLLVLGYGRCILYHNNGDGTFTDVTARSGMENVGRWGSSAAWFDYDNDGRLDLVIVNYVAWAPEHDFWCGDHALGMRSYCHPNDFDPVAPTLFHNNGDGTFTDVSKSSGIGLKPANGLGVVTFDYDGDGWQDIFIANDSLPNLLFRNNHDGTFTEVGYMAGVAVSLDGQPEAGMGVDAGDVTGSGRFDLAVTHLDSQLARFYRNTDAKYFDDVTLSSKIGYATYHMSEFGTRFMDYDNDGALDLFMACGHVLDNVHRYKSDVYYAEPKLMFRNTGHGIFENVSDQLGPDFQLPTVGRGAAVGDFDNDGDLDILVSNNGQRPQLLRNDGGNANHWLQTLLIGTKSNRDGVGARVKVTAGDLVLHHEKKGGMSYESAQDPRLHFGLGNRTQVDAVEVLWPSGGQTRVANIKADQIVTIKEREGLIVRAFPRVPAL